MLCNSLIYMVLSRALKCCFRCGNQGLKVVVIVLYTELSTGLLNPLLVNFGV